MLKVVSIITIILFFILLPPAVLAFASQDSLPGEALYPVKRGLEGGILAIASLNPSTKAWFSLDYTNRRFSEATKLINKGEGKKAKSSLNDLVIQTNQVAAEIQIVQDQGQKKKLLVQLNKSINDYKQGLTQIKQPTEKQPTQTTNANPTNSPSPALPRPQPSSTTFSPTPSATPLAYNPPPPPNSLSNIDQDIDETIKELDRIEKELNNRQDRSSMIDEQRNNRDGEQRQDRGEMRKRNENQDEHEDED